jgi:hypothetical protein
LSSRWLLSPLELLSPLSPLFTHVTSVTSVTAPHLSLPRLPVSTAPLSPLPSLSTFAWWHDSPQELFCTWQPSSCHFMLVWKDSFLPERIEMHFSLLRPTWYCCGCTPLCYAPWQLFDGPRQSPLD